MGQGRGRGRGMSQPRVAIRHVGTGDIARAPNARITFQNDVNEKSIIEAYILGLVLGVFGAHHFYLRRTGYGLAYLLTLGLFGVGYLIDLLRMPWLVEDANRKLRHPEDEHERSAIDAYILWFPFGIIGFHHFYLRNFGLGLLYFFTLGVFGIGWLIDAARIPTMVDDINRRLRNNDPEVLKRSASIGYLFAVPPLGFLGGHHYYLNRPVWGLLYTFTWGLMGIGWLFDLFRINCLVDRFNNNLPANLTQEQLIKNDDKKYLDDAYILLFPFGILGLHHFYLRHYGWGVLYFFTYGICGIGYLIDYFRLPFLVSDYNKARKENLRIASNFLSRHSGVDGAPQPAVGIVQHGGISGSVMDPPPQAFAEAYAAYAHQRQGGVFPVLPGAVSADLPQPPSYQEAVGAGNPPIYQIGMEAQQRPPDYGNPSTSAQK